MDDDGQVFVFEVLIQQVCRDGSGDYWAAFYFGRYGGGSDIWNSSDQFRYNYTAFSGDSAIIAHVTSISSGSVGSKMLVG